MILGLLFLPVATGLAAFWMPAAAVRRALLALTAVAHAGLVAACWMQHPAPVLHGWLELDPAGLLFLSITSLLFLIVVLYSQGASARHAFDGQISARATACLLWFLATMTLVCTTRHLGLLWVGVEATTLATAPLIYSHRTGAALEAAWKYLMICSIGIALALLGNFLLAVATMQPAGGELPLQLDVLLARGPSLHAQWLKAAFIFLLIGYGTKMGLAPLHTWLPDAHGESPSLVSALLSGALLNCAFLGILRAHQVCLAAGLGDFSGGLLRLFGLISMVWAAVFILGQTDFKRMLAYSSVEHMGILSLGIGLGGAGVFGSLLHAINHSLVKGMLFMAAGNILAHYGTKMGGRIQGMRRTLPLTALLWVAGFFAITGSPPFGTFLSEFTILGAATAQGRWFSAAIYLGALALIFIGMGAMVLRMSSAAGPAAPARMAVAANAGAARESWPSVLAPAIPGALALALGVYLPSSLVQLLHAAARLLGGQ